jgi:hypothetical protein
MVAALLRRRLPDYLLRDCERIRTAMIASTIESPKACDAWSIPGWGGRAEAAPGARKRARSAHAVV